MKILINHFFKGNLKLWKSYWLVGEILNALFILLIFNLEIYLLNNNAISNSLPFFDFTNFTIISKILLFIWTIFITIGIWRSAENYKGNIIWIVITFLSLSYRIFTFRLILFG